MACCVNRDYHHEPLPIFSRGFIGQEVRMVGVLPDKHRDHPLYGYPEERIFEITRKSDHSYTLRDETDNRVFEVSFAKDPESLSAYLFDTKWPLEAFE